MNKNQNTNENQEDITAQNFYRAFLYKKGLEIDVRAATTREAQLLAQARFKARNPWDVEVVLLAKGDGVPITHDPQEVAP